MFCLAASLAAPRSAAAEPLRVLFIGNSLTAWNDLPNLFASLAQAGGQDRPVTRTVAVNGFSLEDHWNDGRARSAITERRWDIVVLQQGPSALLESRRLLVAYARRFAELVRSAGARPALYMVWPATDRARDFAGVSASYAAAARAIDGILLPVGDRWRTIIRDHPDIPLYSDDGLHPTRAGSYLAALVMYHALYGAPVAELPGFGVPEDQARRLRNAVR